MSKTISSTFGMDAANELAAIAIDLLCEPPKQRKGPHTRTAHVSWARVERGRQVMSHHGIHWRAIKATHEHQQETRA